MSINQEILSFSNACPNWMRDLIRRIAQQTSLTANDMQEVLANLKASEGLCTAGNCTSLAASHLSGRTSTSHNSTILISVSDVKNANQLAPNQTMPFAPQGITIVFGYNGSGKTGYGRILRQLCRSRHDNKQTVLGNVYGSAARVQRPLQLRTGWAQLITPCNGRTAPHLRTNLLIFPFLTQPPRPYMPIGKIRSNSSQWASIFCQPLATPAECLPGY